MSTDQRVSPQVLVLGARGRLGLAVTRAFAQAGWTVVAQVRPGATLPSLAGVRPLAIDLVDTAGLAQAAAGSRVLVHALNPAYTLQAWRTEAPAMLEAGIAVAERLGARLMLPGNIYNFGEQMPAVLREDTPQQAGTVKGQVRIAMEQRLRQVAAEGRVAALVLRAGDFFGGGVGSWLDQLIVPKLRQGRMAYPGALDVPTAWAYLPDLARSFVQLAAVQDRLPAFDTLHFGGYALTGQDWRDTLTDLAWEQGWLPRTGQLRVGGMPWTLLRLGSWANPVWASLAEMRYLWQRPHRLANERLCACIGAEPHTPFPEAVRQALAELGLGAGVAPGGRLPQAMAKGFQEAPHG